MRLYVPKRLRNAGYSFGLEYPFIYGNVLNGWKVWNRHTGEITAHRDKEWDASKECEKQNAKAKGMKGDTLPVDTAAIDSTP